MFNGIYMPIFIKPFIKHVSKISMYCNLKLSVLYFDFSLDYKAIPTYELIFYVLRVKAHSVNNNINSL